ncbi:Ankyrin repeat-containing protein [Artemisia annua]|nr:Ankyrin repeat-containing protein [Artemisia annua]
MRIIDPVISSLYRFFGMKVQPPAEEDTDALKLLKIIWRHVCETMNLNEIQDILKGTQRSILSFFTQKKKERSILFVAAERGNTRFIAEVLRTYPDLMFDKNEDGLTIFHIAVLHRHQGIYNLLYEIGSANHYICLLTDEMDNNMLHLVGKSSKEMQTKMAGPSLLVQREILWFKEVEKMMPPYLKDVKNKNGQTAFELFSKENEHLVSKGLKWMNECMIVDTLIVAVAFGVFFTVPGGFRQDNGFPIFLHEISYLVFVISDGISLLLSAISLLVFLSIRTSRYGPRDLMDSLPSLLMIGLLGLVGSVAAMTVTFTASFFMLYRKGLIWLPILCASFAFLPAIVFVALQYPLLIDMYRSMFDSRYLFNPKKQENKDDYLEFGVPLYEASLKGDWETANLIFDKRPKLVSFGLSRQLGTALHVAATAEETELTIQFVRNLVNMMKPEELELLNQSSNTAFWIASATGNVEMAKIMMEKNCNLQNIRGADGLLPLARSASGGGKKIVKYLYDKSQKMIGDHWTEKDRAYVIENCVERDLFDLALQIVNDFPELELPVAATVSVFKALAGKPDAFATSEKNIVMRIMDPVISPVLRFFPMEVQSAAKEDTDALKLLKIIWEHVCKTMNLNEIKDKFKGPPSLLFVAAERGNTRFIAEVLRTYPDLMFDKNEDGLTIFHIAVLHRHQGIYNLLYKIGSANHYICLLTDKMDNNMLHSVGKSSKEMQTKMPGPSLLVQREILWFKEVEKMMPPYLKDAKNENGQTAFELFSQENEHLVSKGLKWMNECMIVDTLIVAIAFGVFFTVPGGFRQDNGFPIFLHKISYLVFVIADGISLLLSAISLLVFLSIRTSRYGPRDLMDSLPSKLMIGLLGLVGSVAAMMVTFTASFFMLYHKGLIWLPILCATFAFLPVIVFVALQYPLLVDMYRSMYDSRYLFNPKKRMLYSIEMLKFSVRLVVTLIPVSFFLLGIIDITVTGYPVDMKKETKTVPFAARRSIDLRRLRQQDREYQKQSGQQNLRRRKVEIYGNDGTGTGTEEGEVMTWKNRMKVACGVAEAGGCASETLKAELRSVFSQLCQDDMPMVRRAVASNLGKFAATAEAAHLKTDIMQIFEDLTQDDQDSVRLLAVEGCASLGKLLKPEDCVAHILPVIVNFSQMDVILKLYVMHGRIRGSLCIKRFPTPSWSSDSFVTSYLVLEPLWKTAYIRALADMHSSVTSSDGGKSDVIDEGSSTIMLDEVLDVLIQIWERVQGAKALRQLPKETKLQVMFLSTGSYAWIAESKSLAK